MENFTGAIPWLLSRDDAVFAVIIAYLAEGELSELKDECENLGLKRKLCLVLSHLQDVRAAR